MKKNDEDSAIYTTTMTRVVRDITFLWVWKIVFLLRNVYIRRGTYSKKKTGTPFRINKNSAIDSFERRKLRLIKPISLAHGWLKIPYDTAAVIKKIAN